MFNNVCRCHRRIEHPLGSYAMRRVKQKGFRSSREKLGFFIYCCVFNFVISMRILLLELSLIEHIAWSLAIALPGAIGWWAWERWGRERFPLPATDESQSAT